MDTQLEGRMFTRH